MFCADCKRTFVEKRLELKEIASAHCNVLARARVSLKQRDIGEALVKDGLLRLIERHKGEHSIDHASNGAFSPKIR